MSVQKRNIVSLGLDKLNRSEKVAQGNATHLAIGAEPVYFPPAEVAALMTELESKTNILAEADAATGSGSRESYAQAQVAENEWDTTMRKVGSFVQIKADASPANSEAIIRAAALRSKKEPEKQKPPMPVEDMLANVTGYGNAIKLKINSKNPYGTRFEIEMTLTPDVDNSWQSIAQITARKLLVQGLINGQRYYFRVRSINNLGKSVYSEAVSQVAA